MHRNVRPRSGLRRTVLSISAGLIGVAGGAGLGGTCAGAAHRAGTGGTASYAFSVGSHFSWMLPLENQTAYAGPNLTVEDGMWLPLYSTSSGSGTGIDYGRSIGDPPSYSNHDTTVTITMKHTIRWSTGAAVTARDVKFFFELDSAGKHTLGDYIPGEMPDDITSIDYPNPYQVVLHLDRSYSPTWFTDNQLTWITPLPAQAWNKTCSACPVGSAATTPAGADSVFKFLMQQSESLRTYTTNPLWKTVDGPWVISSYNQVNFAASFAANESYTGPTKPKLAGYKLYSYTTPTAEINALRAGSVTFGYLPLSDLSQAPFFKSHGYTVKAWKLFYSEGIEFGYTSKTWGPLVKQLYLRQALQHLVNEHLYIKRTLGGYGIPDFGPVADYPNSPYVAPAIRTDPYPYDPAAAAALLGKHGWVRGAGGIDVCARPGAAPTDCGPGVGKGTKLDLRFMYSTGTTSFFAQVSAFATVAKSVGVGITLAGLSTTSMYTAAGVCPSAPPCKWGLAGYAGYLWPYTDNTILPTGKNEFGKGNFWAGGYTTPTAQSLIDAADHQAGRKALYADEEYLSKQVASLWWPLEDEIVVVKNSLGGWKHLSPYGTIDPSNWYFSS